MIRLTELILLLLPLAAFLSWRLLAPGQVPSTGLIGGTAVLLLILAGALVWLRTRDEVPPDSIYVPRHIENGKIIPERALPGRGGP